MATPETTDATLHPVYPRTRVGRALTPVALTALRIGVGVIMMVHGWAKLTGLDAWREQVAGLGLPMPNVLALLAVAGELLGGAGLIVGFLTPLAAFGVLAVMATAIGTVHLGKGLLAENGGFEHPLALGLSALVFLVYGGGPYSLDALFLRRFRARTTERARRVPAVGGVIDTPAPPRPAQPPIAAPT